MVNTNTFKCMNCGVYYISKTDNVESVEKAPCSECDSCALSVVNSPESSSRSDNISSPDRSPHSTQPEDDLNGLEAEKTAEDLYYRVSRYSGR